jgi:catechol 2,3-dioxygenase-like lactoylglutathione lyase family enzyme
LTEETIEMAIRTQISGIVLGAPDAGTLARFYHDLLGWPYGSNEPGWVTLRPPAGGPGLSFQSEDTHVRPVWPGRGDAQQMQMHLDIEVDDLDEAGAHAIAAGATLADFQPQQDVRVYLDPAGHPFCLWVRPDSSAASA